MPVLIMKDRGIKAMFANVVPAKGRYPYAIKRVAQNIGLLGYKSMTIKYYQEPAIVDLRNAVKDERTETIIPEDAPVKESQLNGESEEVVQDAQDRIRCIKSSMEARYEQTTAGNHPCIPWLVRHAAMTYTRYAIGVDGQTAYERTKGNKFAREVAELRENVWYYKPGIVGRDN